jgi:uncharacterized protein (TIGR03086 family)
MTEPHELHRRAGEGLAATVRQVGDEEMHRPTPCSEWDVRDLLHHITWSNLWVGPLVDGKDLAEVAPTLEGDVLGEDPVGITLRAIGESSDAFERGGDRPVQLSRGLTPATIYCLERMNDLTVHNWDLAAGIGVDVRLDDGCMQAALDAYRPYEAAMRAAGELGPDVEIPDDADLQTRYLSFFGRRTDWSPPVAD